MALEQGGGEDGIQAAAYESHVKMVRFPRKKSEPDPSLKLSSVGGDENSSSVTKLWQVYILGGVMIARWAWARWRERASRRMD